MIDKNTAVLVDGYGFVFRAYYSMQSLTDREGKHIGAVYGFTNMMLNIIRKFDTKYFTITLDSKGNNFRHDIFPDYKANREGLLDDELIRQFPIIREACNALNVYTIEQQGYEADDVIATLTHELSQQNIPVVIVSSDKDLMQLVDDDKNISMYDASKDVMIREQEVYEKTGVNPEQIIDLQSLTGDATDNIPGVAGIGIKGGADLINKFGSLDNIYLNIDEIKKSKRKDNLIAYKEDAYLSKKLVTLKSDVEDVFHLEEMRRKHFDYVKLFSFLNTYSFDSIINKIEQQYQVKVSEFLNTQGKDTTQIHCVNNEQELQQYMQQIDIEGKLALHLQDNILHLCCSAELPIVQIDLGDNSITQHIKKLLCRDDLLVISHNIKDLMRKLKTLAISLTCYEDIMLMSYLLHSGKHDHSLTSLCKIYLQDTIFNREMQGLYILKLYNIMQNALYEKRLKYLYYKIEKPIIRIVYNMEQYGISIDVQILQILSQELKQHLYYLQEEIYRNIGMSFNLASSKETGNVLFSELGLTPNGKKPKKSKTGAYSTSAELIEHLIYNDYPIGNKILEWRTIHKLITTYTDALPKQIIDGKIHTNFSVAKVITGRLSSSNPNLQNIPVRNTIGTQIRSAFVAQENYKLVSIDYSQIELRLLAEMAEISSLQEAFKENQDIHSRTAADIFAVPIKDVDKNLRRKAKAINFGILYGISPFGLAKQIHISNQEAKLYIDKYLATYQGVQRFIDARHEYARKFGFIKTLYNRICHIPDINSKNAIKRHFSERLAVNATLQGSAADIIKIAMVKLDYAITQQKLDANVMLQIHDELLIEVAESDLDCFISMSKNIMENVVQLSVPLVVNINTGCNWGQL